MRCSAELDVGEWIVKGLLGRTLYTYMKNVNDINTGLSKLNLIDIYSVS